MGRDDEEVKVSQKVKDLGAAYGAFEAEKARVTWGHRCAFVGYCVFLGLGVAQVLAPYPDSVQWFILLRGLGFWFIALTIAVGAFGARKGR